MPKARRSRCIQAREVLGGIGEGALSEKPSRETVKGLLGAQGTAIVGSCKVMVLRPTKGPTTMR